MFAVRRLGRCMQIESYVSDPDVQARYELRVRTTVSATYQAVLSANLSDSWLVRALMRARGYGREIGRGSRTQTLADNLRRGGFVQLAHVPDREIVFGIAGRFWTPRGGLVRGLTAETFRNFSDAGYAKAAWNFAVTAVPPDETLLSTETRVVCFGRSARAKFRAYWLLVAPFSGLIRRAMLRQIKHRAERG